MTKTSNKYNNNNEPHTTHLCFTALGFWDATRGHGLVTAIN